jgi:uncharacterized membrane protein HdeD (DUF308 family)
MSTAPAKPLPIPNTAKTAAIIWWISGFVFLLGIFTPFWADFFNAETDNWMFATMFFSLVICITSIVMAVMYGKRARIISRILRGENLLTHWTYTLEEWSRYAKKEHQENKQQNRNLFLLVAVIAVVIGIIFIIGQPEDWVLFVLIVLGIVAIAGSSALLAVALSKRQNRKYKGEVFITASAVFINRVLHLWKGFGAALEEVKYEAAGRAIPLIIIEYSVPSRGSRQSWTVRVPVPYGHEAEAEIIVQQLQNQAETD